MLIRFSTELVEEVSLLYVPRRNAATGKIDRDFEVDLIGSIHYDEMVLGLGVAGNIKDAAWRWDLVWSSLEEEADKSGYISFVVNLDYSWVWFNRNIYGFIEYYHNGLGKDNYTHALENPALMERTDRGELFARGILQPRAVFSITQNSTLLVGANIFYGSKETEYGGFLIPDTNFNTNASADAIFF